MRMLAILLGVVIVAVACSGSDPETASGDLVQADPVSSTTLAATPAASSVAPGIVEGIRGEYPSSLFELLSQEPIDVGFALPPLYRSVLEATPSTEFFVDDDSIGSVSDLMLAGPITAVESGSAFMTPLPDLDVLEPPQEQQVEFGSEDSQRSTVWLTIEVAHYQAVPGHEPEALVMAELQVPGRVSDIDALAALVVDREVVALLGQSEANTESYEVLDKGRFLGFVNGDGDVTFPADDDTGQVENFERLGETVSLDDLLDAQATRIDLTTDHDLGINHPLRRSEIEVMIAARAAAESENRPRISVQGDNVVVQEGAVLLAEASGFAATSEIVFLLCSREVEDDPSQTHCDLSTAALATADESGAASTEFTIRGTITIGTDSAPESVDCAIDGCLLVAGNPNNFEQAAAWPFHSDGAETLQLDQPTSDP